MTRIAKTKGAKPKESQEKQSATQPEGSNSETFNVTLEEVTAFTRAFSEKIDGGESIVRSLEALTRAQENAQFAAVIDEVNRDVQGGATLSASLGRHPNVFDEDYVSAIRLGETNGTLDQSLRGLGDADGVLSFEQAMQFLGTSKPTLYRLLADKKLKGLKVGRQWRFRRADLIAYMERKPETVSSTQFEDLEAEVKHFQTLIKRQTPPIEGETKSAEQRGEQLTVALVNAILIHAIESQASDIHLEMTQADILLRLRIDGMLHEIRRLPSRLEKPIFNRFKAMADLKLEQRDLPQDGRLHLEMAGTPYIAMVNFLPTAFGGSLVMQVWPQMEAAHDIIFLELRSEEESALRDWINRPTGLILVCGPDGGSGKTTTLYSLLALKAAPEIKTMTVEDPVEQAPPYVTQTHVNRKSGLTFATALRVMLHQDPDIIYLSALPDRETAQLALEAAATGHMVLSSLSAISAAGAVARLVEMSDQPVAVAGSLIGVTSQRLLRRLCDNCKKEAKPSAALLRRIREEAARGGYHIPTRSTFFAAVGCEKCRRNGYLGRLPVYELLPVSAAVSEAILNGENAETLRDIAVAEGMQTLVAAAVRRIVAGETTLEEVARVLFTGAM